MRALHVTTDFPFIKDGKVCNEGGLGVCVTQLIDGLKDSGWEIDILTRKTDDIDGEIYPGYVYRTGYFAPTSSRDWKLTHSFTLIPKLISLLMKTDYDIVHIHNPPAALFASAWGEHRIGRTHSGSLCCPPRGEAGCREGWATGCRFAMYPGWVLQGQVH